MSDYYSQQRKRNIIVGTFVIVGLCALFWLIMIFQELPVFVSKVSSFRVYVQFPEAPGVSSSTPVKYCGYQIGRVIEVMPPALRADINTGRVYNQTLVILAIEKDYKNIPSNVDIAVIKRGLGSSYIEIKDRFGLEPAPLDPNNPDTMFLCANLPVLQGRSTTASEFIPDDMKTKVEDALDSFNLLLANANKVIGDTENQEKFKKLLTNTDKAAQEAVEVMNEVRELAKAGRTAIKNTEQQMSHLADSIINSSDELAYTLSQVQISLDKINKGDGTMGKLINDGELYENMLDSTEELKLAISQLRLLITESRHNGLPIKLK